MPTNTSLTSLRLTRGTAYLTRGTDGPVPKEASAHHALERQLAPGPVVLDHDRDGALRWTSQQECHRARPEADDVAPVDRHQLIPDLDAGAIGREPGADRADVHPACPPRDEQADPPVE